MRCIVCEAPNRLKLVAAPEPRRSPGHALLRIRRIGLCGTDIHAVHGRQPYFSYPRVLGHELGAIVEEINPDIPGLEPGDQVSVIPYLHCGSCVACRGGKPNCCVRLQVLGVHADGGMAEFLAVPATHLLNTNALTFDQSAIIEPLSIGAHAVRRSGIARGETALVIGAGPIGLGVMAFAKGRGARVIALDISADRLAAARSFAQADALVDAARDPLAEVSALTGGDLPAVVFDATGNAASMSGALQYVASGGRLVYVGLVRDDISLSDPEIHRREVTMMASRNATKEDFETVLSALGDGFVQADRYVTHHVPFAEFPGEFERLTKPETRVIKAVLEL
jgi:2-desacetyl-2-hydroxyethyl bacteriochlorophyllide A dehydrogenase